MTDTASSSLNDASAQMPANTQTPMNRRTVLAGAAVAGLAGSIATAAQAESGHHHHEAAHGDLSKVALECVGLGEACVGHCIDVLATGDTSLADCLRSVNAMLPMCGALAQYAASDAKRLKQLAKLCIDICDDCAKECEKHADKHESCKACGEACNTCIKACKDLVAA